MEERSHVKYYAIKLAVYVAIAISIFIFREKLVADAVLKYFIGGLMTLYGVEEILFEIVFKDKHFWHKDKIYLGIIELTFGITLLIINLPYEADYEAVCVVWATWSIVRESFEIKELVTEIKSWTLTIISGIESIAVIVLSVMLILKPEAEHALVHMYLLVLELVLTPLIPMLDEILLERKHKKQEAKAE